MEAEYLNNSLNVRLVGVIDSIESKPTIKEVYDNYIIWANGVISEAITNYLSDRGFVLKNNGSSFGYDGLEYCLEAHIGSTSLIIDINSIRIGIDKRLESSTQLDGFTDINSVLIRMPQQLQFLNDALIGAASLINNFLGLKNLESSEIKYDQLSYGLGKDFYSLLRKILPKELIDNSWFWFRAGDKGFYLLDDGSRKIITDKLSKHFKRQDIRIIDKYDSFLTSTLDVEGTFTHKMLSQNRYILPMNFTNAGYKSNSIFIQSELAVYEKESAVGQIISALGDYGISVGLPSDISEMDNQRFIDSKHEFDNFISSNRGKLNKIKKSLEQRNATSSRSERRLSSEIEASLPLIPGFFSIKCNYKVK